MLPAAVFLPKAAAANRFEIIAGQLAQQRSTSDAIKDLGAMFEADHSTLTGNAFDIAWLKAQLRAHHKALFLHLRAAIRGENDAIRTLGQGALPIITQHLGELIDLATTAGKRGHHTRDAGHR